MIRVFVRIPISVRSFGRSLLPSSLLRVRSGIVMASATRAKFSTAQRERYERMPLEEKRRHYACGENNFVTVHDTMLWPVYARTRNPQSGGNALYDTDRELNQCISLFTGDITRLEIDAIVNAANQSLAGGGGVDGAIHRAAGRELKTESMSLAPCPTGQVRLTGGYRLPAKYVLHTVGPMGVKPDLLTACYRNCLDVCAENDIKTVAFPCISTGVYGYPNEPAAHVVLKTCRLWLQSHPGQIQRIIFCLFMQNDIEIYGRLLHQYFPLI